MQKYQQKAEHQELFENPRRLAQRWKRALEILKDQETVFTALDVLTVWINSTKAS